jgi:hypothetical protein
VNMIVDCRLSGRGTPRHSWAVTDTPARTPPQPNRLCMAATRQVPVASLGGAPRVGVKWRRCEAGNGSGVPCSKTRQPRQRVVCQAHSVAPTHALDTFGDRLRAACFLFWPGRTRSAARAATDRLEAVLSVDREDQAALAAEDELMLHARVRQVLSEYVELQDVAASPTSTLKTRRDASGTTVYSLQFSVKRTKVGIDAGLREREGDAALN